MQRHLNYRLLSATSLSVGSAAAATTAVFGSQTYAIRVITDKQVRLVVTDGAVTSALALSSGAMLPANVVEYFAVTPGQMLTAVSPVASNATITVAEVTA
jgi:hypothetical protein